MNEKDGLERSLVLAGLDALRQIRGDEVVRTILEQAATSEPEAGNGAPGQVPIVDYLRYRDAALAVLGETFRTIAYETGRTLVRNLQHVKMEQIRKLLERLAGQSNKLFLIGQAATLAAQGSPGVVRAAFEGDETLSITILECPECRGLREASAFCYLNQGMITEFAARYLDTRVLTRETSCMAVGAPFCRTEVSLAP